MVVRFKQHTMSNRAAAQVVEDAFRAYFCFTGTHDFKFNTLYPAVSGSWHGNASGTTDVSYTGTNWAVAWHDVICPKQHVVKYRATAWGHGIAFAVDSADSAVAIIFGVNGTGNPVGVKNNVVQFQSPLVVPQTANFVIAMRLMSFTSTSTTWWRALSLWANGTLMATWIVPTSLPQYTTRFGVAAPASVTFYGLTIPQLCDSIEWNSLDPGEFPIGGLQRAIEGRYLKMFMRYDGTLYAWRPVERAASFTFDKDDHIEQQQITVDRRALYTHVRMVGGYAEAEYRRDDLGPHRFTEINNPFLLSVDDCYREAQAAMRRMEEQATMGSIAISYHPMLENEDRVTIPDGDFIIDNSRYQFGHGTAQQTVALRKYTGGT